MGSSPSVPAAPDPTTTANAQTASNQATALYQAQLNNVNQVTPYGNETFTQTSGAPTYDYDAYNQALAAYQATQSPPNPSSGTTSTGVPLSSFGPDASYYPSSYAQTPSQGVAPQLSDYQTNTGAAPQFTSTIQLSPAEQTLLNNQQALQTQQQGIAGTALNQAQANQSTPYSLAGLPQLASASNISDAENAGYKDVMNLMQPTMTQNDELLTSQLANQGITQGSAAYNSAMLQHAQANNAAYSQAALTGVQAGQALQQEALSNNQQAVANYTQQYNAPINEYQALNNGVQVQNPSFASTGNTQVAPTNTLAATQAAYQAQLNSYNAATASNNSAAGGLFGLGGSFLGNSSLGSLFGGSSALPDALTIFG